MAIYNFFKKHYLLFLVLVVLVSYGQLLGMYVWQDDNALFFKLANIEGRAGYLGYGPFGEGAYKYTATPYILLYWLFGFKTVPYFVLALVFYFLSTLAVFKTFSEMIGKKAGRLAGFLYAAGYVASDGFIRLYNTIISSLSIIFISGLTLFYWRFYQKRRGRDYFFALLFFYLACEFARSRTHYLMAVVFLFEIIFFALGQLPRSLLASLLRLLPFVYIFHQYFIVGADARSGQVKEFLLALSRGEFYQTYGFLSSLSNTFLPDRLVDFIFKIQSSLVRLTAINAPYIWILTLISFFFLSPLLWLAILFWLFVSRNIFSTPILNLGEKEFFTAFLGGMMILISFLICLRLKKEPRKLFLFLFLWLLINLGAYSAYNPTVTYATINRYLAHSLFALVGILALLFENLRRKEVKVGRLNKLAIGLIFFWGFGNILNSLLYQNWVIKTRSLPPKRFYRQLKEYLPAVEKGSVFYFDVADDAKGSFTEAFSVAQMPETTAIAWRYGLDRYDIEMVTDFQGLILLLEEKNISLNNIHSFFYSKEGLVDTTQQIRRFLKQGSREQFVLAKPITGKQTLVIDLPEGIQSVTPVEIEMEISAIPLDSREIKFPYYQNISLLANRVAKEKELRRLAFGYLQMKSDFFKQATIETSNDWQERVAANLLDQDPETVWQADRILWQDRESNLVIDLETVWEVDRFVWVNAFGSHTPTKYSIEISIDKKEWREVKSVNSLRRVETKEPQVIEFKPHQARFIKMRISETLNGDSPAIAEAWVVPARLTQLGIQEVEEFLEEPFGYVPDQKAFQETLVNLDFRGEAQLFWQTNQNTKWLTKKDNQIRIVYDGLPRRYSLLLPAGGTQITKIKLSKIRLPGIISVNNVKVRHPTFKELVEEK